MVMVHMCSFKKLILELDSLFKFLMLVSQKKLWQILNTYTLNGT